MSATSVLSGRLSDVKRRIACRLDTRAAQFKLAVSTGFVLVAVGGLVLGAAPKSGIAQSIFGVMNLGDDSPSVFSGPPAPSLQYYTPDSGGGPKAPRRRLAHKKSDKLRLARNDAPVALARRSMCVRLCDGFVFPIGDYHGENDRAAHEATCQSECPGAPTALYVVPQGSDSIAAATKVGSNLNYSEMPEAFHYTTFIDETCSCHPRGGNRVKSLLHDFTLRRGDTVMTAKGMQVFHGGASFPFKRKDFVALARSRDVRKGDKEKLKAIERASLVLPATVTAAPSPVLTSDARPSRTKALVHQARN